MSLPQHATHPGSRRRLGTGRVAGTNRAPGPPVPDRPTRTSSPPTPRRRAPPVRADRPRPPPAERRWALRRAGRPLAPPARRGQDLGSRPARARSTRVWASAAEKVAQMVSCLVRMASSLACRRVLVSTNCSSVNWSRSCSSSKVASSSVRLCLRSKPHGQGHLGPAPRLGVPSLSVSRFRKPVAPSAGPNAFGWWPPRRLLGGPPASSCVCWP